MAAFLKADRRRNLRQTGDFPKGTKTCILSVKHICNMYSVILKIFYNYILLLYKTTIFKPEHVYKLFPELVKTQTVML